MNRYLKIMLPCLTILGLTFSGCKKEYRFYAGRFANDGEKGLYAYSFNAGNGSLKLISEYNAGSKISYYCFSQKHNMFYVLNEVMSFNGQPGGGITALKYDNITGSLVKSGEIVVPDGGPCYISLSHDNGYLFLANYPEGSICVVKLGDDGIPERVTDTIMFNEPDSASSHAHMIKTSPDGKLICVSDLGLDKLLTFTFDKNLGKLNPVENGITNISKGSGPRHFIFNDDGSMVYLINELGSTIMVFNADGKGHLNLVQTLSTIGSDYHGENACADIRFSKDGKFLYGSNRGENTIVTYSVGDDGLLQFKARTLCGGNWPRNFIVDPSGRFILISNQRSGDISVFKINSNGIPGKQVAKVTLDQASSLLFRE
jgi:6-phosphogluconolactonase